MFQWNSYGMFHGIISKTFLGQLVPTGKVLSTSNSHTRKLDEITCFQATTGVFKEVTIYTMNPSPVGTNLFGMFSKHSIFVLFWYSGFGIKCYFAQPYRFFKESSFFLAHNWQFKVGKANLPDPRNRVKAPLSKQALHINLHLFVMHPFFIKPSIFHLGIFFSFRLSTLQRFFLWWLHLHWILHLASLCFRVLGIISFFSGLDLNYVNYLAIK